MRRGWQHPRRVYTSGKGMFHQGRLRDGRGASSNIRVALPYSGCCTRDTDGDPSRNTIDTQSPRDCSSGGSCDDSRRHTRRVPSNPRWECIARYLPPVSIQAPPAYSWCEPPEVSVNVAASLGTRSVHLATTSPVVPTPKLDGHFLLEGGAAYRLILLRGPEMKP